MLKGPKGILSSAIANALGTYFEVDANAIESNLIKDAKIVLTKAKLKEQTSRLALNSAGNATKITIRGCVQKIELKWEWSVGYGSQQLVKNAVLIITEANFECLLEHDKKDNENSSNPVDASSFVDTDKIDAATKQEIDKDAGGLMGYIFRQIKMIIDNLELRIYGFDLQIILPSALTLGTDTTEQKGGSPKIILICADELKLLSFGRKDKDGKEITVESDVSKSIVKQQLSLRSFLMSVLKSGDGDESLTEYPLIEPFSYSANVTKAGERFSGMSTGLEVVGSVEMTTSSRRLNLQQDTDSLVFHVGTQQIDTLMQLSVMVLSPPSEADSNKSSEVKSHESAPKLGMSSGSMKASFTSSPSSFHFPIASASLILFENSHAIHVSGIEMNYKADGTRCSVEASKIEYESAVGGKASCNDILLTARPVRKLKFGSIQSLYIPDTLELTNQISPEISFEGKVLIVRVNEPVAVVLYGNAKASPTASNEPSGWPLAPCAVDAAFHEIHITKDADGSSMLVKKLEVYANPTTESTQLAIKFQELKNQVALLSKVEMSCALPVKETNTINDLNLSVPNAEVKGGKSSEEWSDGFRPRPKAQLSKPDENATPTVMKLPNANIATLKLHITWSQTGIGLKNTSLVIKPFHGKSGTTSNDIVSYYTNHCLAQFPEFISNAEVLGINVLDQTVTTIGNWSLLPFLGPGGGVAVITGVDAIKGTVASGKRARDAEEYEGYRPGDFVRGIFHAATEATRDGKAMRGKKDEEGNIIDWAYGATKGTTDYVTKNKTKLGAAGAGGGGFLVGMALGGPIGAVIGGVVGNLAGGKTIETIDSLHADASLDNKTSIEGESELNAETKSK